MSMVHCRGCGKEIHESASSCPHCGAPQQAAQAASASLKSQTAASLFAAFLGAFGAHKFYLGRIGWGIVYFLLCWTGIPGIVAFVEALIMVFMSQQKWAEKYNGGRLTPPVHVAVKVLVLIIPALILAAFLFGVVAAIVVPQYQAYSGAAAKKEVLRALKNGTTRVIANMDETSAEPLKPADIEQIKANMKSDSKHIIEADVYLAGGYIDVGAKVDFGGGGGSIYFVVFPGGDAGQPKCITVNLEPKFIPGGCEAASSLQRPALKKRIGWSPAFKQNILNNCVREAMQRGDVLRAKVCECVVARASTTLPEESDAEGENALRQITENCEEELANTIPQESAPAAAPQTTGPVAPAPASQPAPSSPKLPPPAADRQAQHGQTATEKVAAPTGANTAAPRGNPPAAPKTEPDPEQVMKDAMKLFKGLQK